VKRWMALLILMLLPAVALAQDLKIQTVLDGLDLSALESAAKQNEMPEGDVKDFLLRLARGEKVLNASEIFHRLIDQAAGVVKNSIWRLTRLLIPALLASAAEWMQNEKSSFGKAARYAGLIMTMAFLVTDLREHTALAQETVSRMSGWMQALFPVMVTLMAAVGGTASSAFYQPAVIAAAGSMTALIQQATMPLAVGVAVLTMIGGLSEGLRVSRLCRLLRQAANWTLGFGSTVFIGVMTVQGVNVAAVDGVSIRAARYAIDNFIPIVGGMFSDTVDTLVGCSLVIQHAVGVLGLLLLLGTLLLPLLRTVVTMFLYRAAAALLEPLSDSPLCRAIGGYADVFLLLFIIQLSVGAMFLLLAAQMITVADLTVMLR